MAKEFRSTVSVTSAPALSPLATHLLFDKNYTTFRGSCIDEFTKRLRAMNALVPRPDKFDSYIGQLFLLGAVAAVESFLRSLFRRAISIDGACRDLAMKKEISYAAAVYLRQDLLPEALLEKTSFTSRDNIEKACRELLGLKGEFPEDVKVVVQQYVRICHLRHCAVHRFGKLGASNAVHLGLDDHMELLEKPLLLSYASLQEAIAIATAFVRTLNSFVFNLLLSRLPDNHFVGNYSLDRPRFLEYYDVFRDKESMSKSPSPKDAYTQFMAERGRFLAQFARQQ